MSTIETAARTAMAFNKAVNSGDLEAAMALISEDCVFETAGPAPDGTRIAGKAEVRKHIESMVRAADRAQIRIEDLYGYGKRCILYWRRSWEDAAGEAKHVRGVDIILVEGDRVQSLHSYKKA